MGSEFSIKKHEEMEYEVIYILTSKSALFFKWMINVIYLRDMRNKLNSKITLHCIPYLALFFIVGNFKIFQVFCTREICWRNFACPTCFHIFTLIFVIIASFHIVCHDNNILNEKIDLDMTSK